MLTNTPMDSLNSKSYWNYSFALLSGISFWLDLCIVRLRSQYTILWPRWHVLDIHWSCWDARLLSIRIPISHPDSWSSRHFCTALLILLWLIAVLHSTQWQYTTLTLSYPYELNEQLPSHLLFDNLCFLIDESKYVTRIVGYEFTLSLYQIFIILFVKVLLVSADTVVQKLMD